MGCKACGDTCYINAISFPEDENGFWYPVINEVACVKCGRCVQACPVLKKTQADIQKMLPKVYSAYSKEYKVRQKSTSGGIFYELAAQIIRQGGVVCGCRYSDDYYHAYHSFAENMEELEHLVGSKYFQSDTDGMYRKISSFLKDGRKVLFCGTPCQSAAVQRYLSTVQYDNLLLADFVCLGINSPKGYRAFISELEDKYCSKIKKVRFKDKTRGWLNLGTKVFFENGTVYYGNRYTDPWVNSYIVGKFFIRQSCSVCCFKGIPRVSDITLGDFWGLDFTQDEGKNGVSLVMINSEKGERYFRQIQEHLACTERSVSAAVKGNQQINHQVSLDKEKQNIFFKKLEKEKFSHVVWRMLGSTVSKRYCHWFMILLKTRLVKIQKQLHIFVK